MLLQDAGCITTVSLCSIGGVVIPIPRLVGNEVALLVFCVAYFARREDKAEAAAG